MAILTICRLGSARLAAFGVQTVRVSRLRVGMALGTSHLLRSGLMDEALYIFVAIHTGEHAAMDGMLLLAFIHIEADRLAFEIRGQS